VSTQEDEWASPTPTLNTLFAFLCVIFAALFFQLVDQPAVFLLFGLIQLGLFPAYFAGALILLKNGDMISGNIYLIFATFFTIVPGLTTLGIYFAQMQEWPIDVSILGYQWLFIGSVLAFCIPAFAKASKTFFILICCAASALVVLGLGYLGIISVPIYTAISGGLLFIVCVLVFYMIVSEVLGESGIDLPLGKPFF